MKLEYHSSQFNKDIHKKVSRVPEETRRLTKKDQGEDIRCYLWPGLQDGGGRRIRQAEVLCKLKQKWEWVGFSLSQSSSQHSGKKVYC